jgi:uncharacterized membrane protein required for colicin V production
MIWDGLAVIALLALCLAGWNVGLINSWRGPVAIVVATLVTQQFYIDFSTWICQQTMMTAAFSTFVGYTMMFIAVDIVTEISMSLVLTWGSKDRPQLFNRIGGVALAIVRWVVICTFPLMAMTTPTKIPDPPKHDDGLINPLKVGFEESTILNNMAGFGKSLMPGMGGMIVSNKEPSFKPNFEASKHLE